MRILDPGHKYELDTLDNFDGYVPPTIFFVKRCDPPEKYPGNTGRAHHGPTSQEYMRCLIDRSIYVNNQQWSLFTALAKWLLRLCILLLEWRVMFKKRKFRLTSVRSEKTPVCKTCGYFVCSSWDSCRDDPRS